MEDYHRIKNYLDLHNWHLEPDEFYSLIHSDKRHHKIGYHINVGSNFETNDYFSLHFYMLDTNLYGDVWLKKIKN